MNERERTIYLAGIVDGEGYIGIKKSKYQLHCPSPTYHERIQIRMVEEKAIKLFKETFGGNYYREKPHCAKGRPLYCYQASDLAAANICKALWPYLLIKKKNIELVLQLRNSKDSIVSSERGAYLGKGRGRLMSPKILDYREQLYLQCKKNNKGGDVNAGG